MYMLKCFSIAILLRIIAIQTIHSFSFISSIFARCDFPLNFFLYTVRMNSKRKEQQRRNKIFGPSEDYTIDMNSRVDQFKLLWNYRKDYHFWLIFEKHRRIYVKNYFYNRWISIGCKSVFYFTYRILVNIFIYFEYMKKVNLNK